MTSAEASPAERYVVLITGMAGRTPWAEMSASEQEAYERRHGDFARACRDRDGVRILATEPLQDGSTATSVRTDPAGELVITDGPYAEATEHLNGLYVVEVPDRGTLLELLRVLPPYDFELRPVLPIDRD